MCVGPLSCPLGKPVVQRDPFRCPVKYSQAKGKRYTDALGRSLFAVILAQKNQKNITSCLHNLRPDIGFVRTYSVECDVSGNTCGSMIGVSEEARAIYLGFGDTLVSEMVNGLGAQLGAWEKFEGQKAGVVSYFHNAFYKSFVDSGMKDDALELVKKYRGFRVWITGYSLGGSLASMTSLYLAKKKLVDPNTIRLVTFGEPRTGNVAFAKEIEEHIQFRYRVVKKNDFIASIPRSADPAASLLTATMYERQPLFYRYLVHYDNKMKKGDTFKICELSDDFGCRNTNFAYDLDDHRTYFHIDSDKFVEEGCPRDHLF
ncbi:unnamed protein product [Cylicocyclus nassatus]|uniref:Fungal lipase-type domain-containing protein n=1 Tax=Cylicocyclus nassatus TaxID=53992 RepID=A0AA36HGJ0_CYLNA|nr:unnamed protein product [Cylicocyclus nassatus]